MGIEVTPVKRSLRMNPWWGLVGLVVALGLSSGCWKMVSYGGDASLIGDAGEHDAAVDGSADGSVGPKNKEITFSIGFITDVPTSEFMYVQTSDENGWQQWVSVLDGSQTVPLQGKCTICPCDVCVNCPLCGPAKTKTVQVPSHSSVSWTWKGKIWPEHRCADPSSGADIACQDQGTLAPGKYIARFCYGIGDDQGPFPTEVPSCNDVPFTYPVDGGVVGFMLNNSG